MRLTTVGAVACLLVFAAPTLGWAYVRGVNDHQVPLFWPTTCALVTVYPNGWTGLSDATIATSVAAAAAAWGSTVTCPGAASASAAPPSFDIVVSLAPSGSVGAAALDYKNNVVFVRSDWMYDGQALALTQHSSDSAGRIIDTDIEVNASRKDITWATLDPGVSHPGNNGIPFYDLQTVLTHEFGHFIGLAHTCVAAGTAGSDSQADMPDDPVDDQGVPVPPCTDATTSAKPAAFASVMWYTVTAGSADKRSLTSDDVHAVCDLYPPSQSAVCTLNRPNDGCGCETPGGRSSAADAFLLLGFWLVLTGRRVRRDVRYHGPHR
jgi:hypothetical protein